jgi:hypothetical protein
MTTGRKRRWTRHAAYIEKRDAHKIFVGKPE